MSATVYGCAPALVLATGSPSPLSQLQLRKGSQGELLWMGQREDYASPEWEEWSREKLDEHRQLSIENRAVWVTVFESDWRFVLAAEES